MYSWNIYQGIDSKLRKNSMIDRNKIEQQKRKSTNYQAAISKVKSANKYF